MVHPFYKYLGITFIMSILGASSVFGQDTLALDMQGLLEYCKANNNTIKLYQAQQNLEAYKTDQLANWWFPDLYAGLEYQARNGAAMNTEGNFINVNRRNIWSGLGIDASWDFKDKYLVKKQKWTQQAWLYKSASNKNKMLLGLINNYYNLLQSQVAVSIYSDLVAESQSILDQIDIQVKQGLRYPSELLLGKSYLHKTKIDALNKSERYQKSLSKIRAALSISNDVVLVVVDSTIRTVEMDADLSKSNIRNKRPEFREYEMEHHSLESEMNMYSKGMWLPELKLNTNASLFGGVFTPFDPTGILNVSLLWQIPYDLLVHKSDIDIVKAKMESIDRMADVKEDEINMEVMMARSSIDIANQQLELSEEALEFANKALYQSIERQKLGTAQPLEVYRAQELNIQLKLQYLEAITKYNKAQFALFVALGNEL